MMWTCYEMQRGENITVEKVKTGKRVSGSGAFTVVAAFPLFCSTRHANSNLNGYALLRPVITIVIIATLDLWSDHYNLDVERYHDVSSRSALKKTESSFHILFFYYFLHNENHVWQEFLNIIRGIINSLCLTFIYSWKNSSSMKKNL